jgi:hypothetical protein
VISRRGWAGRYWWGRVRVTCSLCRPWDIGPESGASEVDAWTREPARRSLARPVARADWASGSRSGRPAGCLLNRGPRAARGEEPNERSGSASPALRAGLGRSRMLSERARRGRLPGGPTRPPLDHGPIPGAALLATASISTGRASPACGTGSRPPPADAQTADAQTAADQPNGDHAVQRYQARALRVGLPASDHAASRWERSPSAADRGPGVKAFRGAPIDPAETARPRSSTAGLLSTILGLPPAPRTPGAAVGGCARPLHRALRTLVQSDLAAAQGAGGTPPRPADGAARTK